MSEHSPYTLTAQGRTAPLAALLQTRLLAKQLKLPKLRLATQGSRTGENLSKRGRGVHFEESRMYQAGDDIRHIDWRVTARTGETHTKVFREEHERPVVFLVDLNPGMYFGTRACYKSVLAAHITAILAFAATYDGNPVGGLVLSSTMQSSPVHGKEKGVLPLLQKISEASLAPTDKHLSMAVALREVRHLLKAGSLLVIISDFYDLSPEVEQNLTQIAYRHPVWLLRTVDPIEMTPPPAGHYSVSDGTHFSWLDMQDKTQRIAYQHFCEEKQRHLTNLTRSLGLTQIDLLTNQPLLPQLTALTRSLSHL